MLVLIFQSGAIAQIEPRPTAEESGEEVEEITFFSRWTLKVNATSLLFAPKSSIMLAAELKLAPRWTVELGAGSFIFSTNFAGEAGEQYTGPRLKAAIKRHVSFGSGDAYYLGLEAKYQNVNHRYYKEMWRFGQQYREMYLVKRSLKTYGVALRHGASIFTDESRRFMIELYNTIGVATDNAQISYPPDAEFIANNNIFQSGGFLFLPGKRTRFDFTFGILVGYSFR